MLGIGSVGCTRHPSKKYIPGKGRISCSGPVCGIAAGPSGVSSATRRGNGRRPKKRYKTRDGKKRARGNTDKVQPETPSQAGRNHRRPKASRQRRQAIARNAQASRHEAQTAGNKHEKNPDSQASQKRRKKQKGNDQKGASRSFNTFNCMLQNRVTQACQSCELFIKTCIVTEAPS